MVLQSHCVIIGYTSSSTDHTKRPELNLALQTAPPGYLLSGFNVR